MPAEDREYIVYMLSCGDGSLYTGITTDIVSRITAHNSGKGAKYTRSRLPVHLVYQETCENRSAALRRELEIKALSREGKLQMLQSYKPSAI